MNAIEMLRAGMDVERFHTIPSAGRQTVGHHTANIIGLIFFAYSPNLPRAQLIHAALTHDMPEAWTGDLPADAKRSHGLASILSDIEREYLVDTMWENHGLMDAEESLLKVCDCLELVLYLNSRIAAGNFDKRLRSMHTNARLYLKQHYDKMPNMTSHFHKLIEEVLNDSTP